MSTLADVIIFETYKQILQNGKIKNQDLEENYLIKYAFITKTSIKPKCFKEGVLKDAIKNKNIYATNALEIYISKRIEDYVNEKGKNEYFNNINNKLNEIKEQFWDYNNFVRSQTRFIKKNPQYAKRLIAESEKKC